MDLGQRNSQAPAPEITNNNLGGDGDGYGDCSCQLFFIRGALNENPKKIELRNAAMAPAGRDWILDSEN